VFDREACDFARPQRGEADEQQGAVAQPGQHLWDCMERCLEAVDHQRRLFAQRPPVKRGGCRQMWR
jgi:hypothetical protein